MTQLTGTWSSSGQALPPRNFRLDPAAARQVLTAVEGKGDGGLDMAAVVTFFDALAPARRAETED